MRSYQIIFIFLLLGLSACEYFDFTAKKDRDKGRVLARVYDRYLYEGDLIGLQFDQASAEDSARMARRFQQEWVRNELSLRQADDYLDDQRTDIDKQVREYKESLITYLYEKELVAEKVSTEVNASQATAYFEENASNFVLAEDIVFCQYFFLDGVNSERDSIRNWFRSLSEGGTEQLQKAGFDYSANFNLEGEWLRLVTLNERLPKRLARRASELQRGKVETRSDSLKYCVVKVLDFGLKGSIAPMDYFRQDIEKIVVNKRKEEYLKLARSKLYEKAIKNKNAELFE